MGSRNKKKWVEAKRKARKVFRQEKCEAERNRFSNVRRRDDQKCEVSKSANRMVKTNYVVGKQCITNGDGVFLKYGLTEVT